MPNHKVSIFLGLTTALTVVAPLPSQAVNFNYDAAQNILVRPIESNNKLFFFGAPSDNQGFTAFFNLDPDAPDVGFTEISLNAPGNIAPYYTTGRDNSPEEPPSGATRTATLQNVAVGFSNFYTYLTNNNIPLADIGFSYGQKNDRPFTSTWNLGDNEQGKNWFASEDSTLDERIYTANPDDVELYLTYGNTQIINFGYTPFYTFFDYGATPSTIDDSESIITDPFTAKKAIGLDASMGSLADAFLEDVSQAGGGVQVVYQDSQVDDVAFTIGNGFGVIRLPFPCFLNAVPMAKVPESSAVLGLLMLGALGVASRLKKKNIFNRQLGKTDPIKYKTIIS